MISVWQDLRHAWRMLAGRKAFTATAVLTLAVGIGANTALLNVVRAVFLQALPYPQANRLVHVWASWPGGFGNFSYPDYTAMVEQARSFDDLAAYESWGNVALTGGDRPVLLNPNFATPSYFDLLGARPVLGRVFAPDENVRPGGHPLAVLSFAIWRRQFGADPLVVGRTIQLNGAPYTVIGVMDAAFADLGAVEGPVPDLWLPTTMAQSLLGQPPLTDPYSIYWGLARLKPGTTLEQARQDLAAISLRLERDLPATHRGLRLELEPLGRRVNGPFTTPVLVLMGGAAFILLIGCANVANLLLARSVERRGEFALRAALGASAWRLVRQLLVESLLLGVAGGALGLLAASWLTQGLAIWVQQSVSPLIAIRQDAWILWCSVALSLATTFLFGLIPALAGSRVDVRDAIDASGRQDASSRRTARRVLVAAEVAISIVLLVGAGLMLRSFQKLVQGNLGFRSANLLTFRLGLTSHRYAEPAARVRFTQALIERTEALPGVESASIWGPSMLGNATWIVNVLPEGWNADRPEAFLMLFRHSVTTGALRNLGIPLLRGRDLTSQDTADTPLVAVVSQSVANHFWPGADPIGKRLRRPDPSLPLLTVVGVAADAQHRQRYFLGDIAAGLGPSGVAPQRDIYLPYAQRSNADVTVAIRVESNPDGATEAIRRTVATLDADLPVHDVRTLDDRIAEQNIAPGAISTLMTGYAMAALLLAAMGLYGVLAHSVSERTREIGIRMALGARPGEVVRLILRQGFVMIAVGATIGVAGSILLSQAMRTLLYDVAPTDVLTFAAAPAVLLCVAGMAMYGPARRATSVDPIVALRRP